MNVELPQTRPYGAVFIVGNRLSGGTVQTIGSIVVKAGFLLTASGSADTHVMTPDPDAGASALALADQGAPFADPVNGMDVSREADIAPFKPLADIAVEGFVSGFGVDTGSAEVRVDNTTWLTRAANPGDLNAASQADRGRHLFGYQPRSEDPRADEAGNPLSEPVPDPLHPTDFPLRAITPLDDIVGYNNLVLNFHRRGGGFAASPSIANALMNGQRVIVRKAGADALSVTLALPPLTVLYRTWCGDGPDKAPYWTRKRLSAMQADTLILRPDASRAEVIWRTVWPWHDEPIDSYRAVRVSEGGP
jgi:hypothetical protein